MDFAEFNRGIIEEFRTNGGKMSGMFEGAPLVLLHTVGRKSGKDHVTPLMSRTEETRVFVFASKNGAPTNPDWYHNLIANPDVTYETGTETVAAKAVEVTGAERDRIYGEQSADVPQFAEYQAKTKRTIPVIELVRA